MKALLVGMGGIGANVYYPELQKLGYNIDTLDARVPGTTYTDIREVRETYDLAVVCTPNHTHREIGEILAYRGVTDIFIEKPGVANSAEWVDMCAYGGSRFHLVKNNLYRTSYGNILGQLASTDIIGVDINWLNDNRIPNPGGWSTTLDTALAGVSGDLMPHLYCFAVKMFGIEAVTSADFKQRCYKRWNMDLISQTDYGTVTPGGTYDVDDYATAMATINNIPVRLTASWKEGYDKQSITLFHRDGSTYEWTFGLCPAEAYGVMLSDIRDTGYLDTSMHIFLEGFKLED
jgi:predicted dehydrogenase